MGRNKNFFVAWVSILLLIFFSAGAGATSLIYDNGAITWENFAGAVGFGQNIYTYNDFHLTVPAQITGVRFWIWKSKSFGISNPYNWEILADSEGWPAGYPHNPGPPVASGSGAQSEVIKSFSFDFSEWSEVFQSGTSGRGNHLRSDRPSTKGIDEKEAKPEGLCLFFPSFK